ncbi:unnamed protein product [Lymnaea stagnalis]|uniref:Ion transport domain-containing protein n=1 Tax=Lymnaea stagnalis TaxID=6523 RepID=A0AAV2I190_LYMST
MEPARVFYSLDYILFALRLLKYCYGSEFLGPLIAMMIGMTSTMTKFLVILLICFLAYVVSSEAVLNPNSEINWKLLYFVSRKAFWGMFGDYHLDEIENQDTSNATCTNDPELYKNYLQPRCPSEVGRYFVPIVLGVFIVLVNLMLFNLIIAKFNSIITDIELRSLHIWNHQMFQLVIEYDQALILQPPLFFLPIILYMINCKQCFNNQVSAAPPECDEVFEKDVVLYLKHQIDDGRFFKRLDTYKRSGKQNLDMLLSTFQDTTDELNRVIADEQRQRGVVERWQTESKTELDEMQRKIAQIQDMFQKSSRNMDTLLGAKKLNTVKSLSVSELEKTQNAIKDLQLSVDSSTNQSRQQDQKLSDQLIQIKDQIRTSEMKMEDNKINFEKILQATNEVGIDVEDLKEKQAKKDGELEILNKNVRTLKVRQKKNDKDLLEKLVVLQEEKPGKEDIDRMIQERSEKTEKMLTTLTGLARRILNKERYEGGES